MKFRQHRGSLDESMKTVVELDDGYLSLLAYLVELHKDEPATIKRLTDESISVKLYPDRRYWLNQHLVTFGNGTGVLGMLDRGLNAFYPDICQRYRRMAVAAIDGHAASNPALPGEFQAKHLMVMLEQIQFTPSTRQSESKKHRWLGFVQAAIIAQGWSTVQIERDFTRDIFNGE